MVTAKVKAEELVIKFDKKIATQVCDYVIEEISLYYRQDRIDYWLDIRNEIRKVEIRTAIV